MKRIITLGIICMLALGACTKEPSCCSKSNMADAGVTGLASIPAMHTTTAGEITDASVFNLDSEWTTPQGRTMNLAQLQGKVQMVAMIYTRCAYACPRIIADLKRIEESLSGYRKDDVGIVLVTMDPAHDTPAKLKEFAASNKLDASRWLLLTSTPDNIRELAAILNMKYKPEPDGEISHSNIISVMNARGEIIHQQEGLGIDPDETVKSIQGLLRSI